MSKKMMKFLIKAGEATPGPPLGTVLGPLGINTGKLVAEMNQKTQQYKGMKIPVKVIIDMTTKLFEVEVGAPPTSDLLRQAAGLEKGTADGSVVGDISMDKVQEVARQKAKFMNSPDEANALKEVIGTCKSIGLTVDGKPAKDLLAQL